MPTTDPGQRLRADEVPAVVHAVCAPPSGTGDRVGLEVELFAVARRSEGHDRLPLPEVLALTSELARAVPGVGPVVTSGTGVPVQRLGDGCALTFEPGGQIEVSGACRDTAAAALDDLDVHTDQLARSLASHEVGLVSAGVDAWHDPAAVPQQLAAPRYPAMAAYFRDRGPWGAVMMRHTASLQVNLDVGTGDTAVERWVVANLVAPHAVAAFGCSPEPGGSPVASQRSRAWRSLDPTRTGFPPGFAEGNDDIVEVMTRAALAADVLLVRGPDTAAPGTRGWSFRSWLDAGHPEHGWPTADDLRYHLTTLFHEVRPRGALELRSIDALPARWRAVPVTLLVGLLYDRRARHAVLDVLTPHRRRLVRTLADATVGGLRDPALCAQGVEVWSYALEGARRLPPGYVRPRDLVAAEAFIDRYTVRGRCPTDELRDLLRRDPELALDWASEPLPATTGVAP